MSFLASVGVTNVDLMYVGMPRVPQEGEEIFSQDFRVLLGGGAPGTAVNAARLGIPTRLATYLGSDLFSGFARAQFEQMIADGELLEYAQYVDNYYGTPKAYVEKQLADGKDVILEIEIQGALKVKKQFPQTLLLFVTPPSAEILKERLIGRGTEDMEIINKRLSRACEEAEGIENYDYLVINDDLDICVEEVHQMIRNEHLTIARNEKAITQMREELKGFLKGE